MLIKLHMSIEVLMLFLQTNSCKDKGKKSRESQAAKANKEERNRSWVGKLMITQMELVQIQDIREVKNWAELWRLDNLTDNKNICGYMIKTQQFSEEIKANMNWCVTSKLFCNLHGFWKSPLHLQSGNIPFLHKGVLKIIVLWWDQRTGAHAVFIVHSYLRTKKSEESDIKHGGRAGRENKSRVFSTGKSNCDVKAAEDLSIWPFK